MATPGTPTTKRVRRALVGAARASVGTGLHRLAVATLALLASAAVLVAAAVAFRSDVTTTPSSKAADIVFESGADYVAINAAGFATLAIGASGTSATLALSGIPGAAQTSLGNVLKLRDTSATVPYTVSLARSAAPDAAISSFLVTVKNGASTLLSWDAAASATSSSFTLPASASLDVSVALTMADGTAAGSLGSFGLQFAAAP